MKETVQNARQDTDRLRQQMQISHETLDKSFNDLVVHIEGSVDEKMENMHRFITQLLQEGNTQQQQNDIIQAQQRHHDEERRRQQQEDQQRRDETQRLYDAQLQQLQNLQQQQQLAENRLREMETIKRAMWTTEHAHSHSFARNILRRRCCLWCHALRHRHTASPLLLLPLRDAAGVAGLHAAHTRRCGWR